MRAVILVGGEGTRLRPLTFTVPKQMLPVVEVPLIERVVAHLVDHGVTDVVLSLGYQPDKFIAGYPGSRCAGATLTYVVEPELLDTAGAVRFAATKAGIDATFLVLNGDVLTDLDITSLIGFHRTHGAEGTIALTPVVDPSAFGVVPTTPDGRVEAFIEKPPPGTAPTNLINAGTYVLEPSVLARIPDGRRVNIERETFPAMVADGSLFAQPFEGYWLDVGTPERYLTATADLLDGRRPGPPAPGARRVGEAWHLGRPLIEGSVSGASLVADGGCVRAGASVVGSVVGRDAVVEAGASVVGSVLMARARVGAGARLTASIVGPGAVIGPHAILGAGTVIGGGDQVVEGDRLPR
ncbi:MAG: sugar phosphate nucleotidyltransferase [Acidimicrobiales bacterium]